jgi:hypothetical protein
VAALALLAGAGLSWTTASGPGLEPDSLVYLLLARGLARGAGLRLFGAPMAHFPPGFPLLLAATGAGGLAGLERASLVQSLLYSANVVLVALMAARLGRASASSSLLAAALFVGSPGMLVAHAMLLSEPAFIGLSTAGALLLSKAVGGAGRAGVLPGAICLGAALLVRYAGLGLLPAAFLTLVLCAKGPTASRLRQAALVVSVAAAPLGLWLARNAIAAGSATNRAFAFHPLGSGHLDQLADATLELWGSLPLALLGEGALVGAALVLATRLLRRKAVGALAAFAILASLGSLALIGVSISLFDVDTPLDSRVLAPTHAFAVAIVAATPALLKASGGTTLARIVLAVLAFGSLASLSRTAEEALRLRAGGFGFDCLLWRASPTLAALRATPPATRVFSNEPGVVAYFAHENAAGLPAWADRTSLAERPSFGAEQETLCRSLRGGAIVAYFDNVGWRWELPSVEALTRACGLRAAKRLSDGVLLEASGDGADDQARGSAPALPRS